MYKVTVKFKKEKIETFENVTSIKVGCKIASPVYEGDSLITGMYPSCEDLTVTHSQGITVIAKNTFESLSIIKP